MSKVIAKFFRNVPTKSLRAYFEVYPCDAALAIDWDEPPRNIVKPLRTPLSSC